MDGLWNLPALRSDGSFPPPNDRSGQWRLNDASLQKLGDSLNLPKQKNARHHEVIRAIPDPWAQARNFAEALIAGDGNHSMYDIALGQWRGLLALFALRDLYAQVYQISPRGFALDSDRMFDRVLAHLHPEVAIGGEAALWKQPLLFMLTVRGQREQPVAMGNPACFVSPGRLTHQLHIPNVPWYGENGLSDPLQADLPVTQLFVLKAWLEKLREGLLNKPGSVAADIAARLNDYINAVGREVEGIGFTADIGSSLHANLPPLYAALFTTASLIEPADGSTTSQTRLRIDPAYALGALKGFVLVDEALALASGFDRRKTIVWGTRTLGELLNSADTRQAVAKAAALKGWAIVTADDLFTPRVARLLIEEGAEMDGASDNDAMIAGNPNGMDNVLVPLRPMGLLFPGPVSQILKARVARDRAIFTLDVMVEGSDGQARRVEIQRHYAKNPGPGEGLFVKSEQWNSYNAAVWPNFRSDNWDSYFVRFYYAKLRMAAMVRPTIALSGRLVAGEIAGAAAGDDGRERREAAIERFHAINQQGRLTAKAQSWFNAVSKSEETYEELQVSRVPIEAIAYFDQHRDRSDAMAGIAMVKLAPPPDTNTARPRVAIDFGTTNTVACFEDKQPVQFANRTIFPINHRVQEDQQFELAEARWWLAKFLPHEARQTPTATVALQRSDLTAAVPHHIFGNLIYFHSMQKPAQGAEGKELEAFGRLKGDAKFDLKWAREDDRRAAARGYLHQFALMVAAETAAMGKNYRHLEWRFSVPDSYESPLRSDFQDGLTKITAQISAQPEGGDLRPLYSEGLCAANYILNGTRFVQGDINIVFDIGGGTTDVTVWARNELKWKGSFKIAGKSFFTNFIIQNPALLGKIGLGHWGKQFEARPSDDSGGPVADVANLAEMLFSGPQLQAAINAHWDDTLSAQSGDELRIVALTFIGGLAWYMGRIVRQLVADGKLEESQLGIPAFALCGRGAGLFKMMHGARKPEGDSEVTRVLKLFSVAAGIEGEPRPQLFTTAAADAKIEVVRGMMSDDGRVDLSASSGRQSADDFLLAGIDLILADSSRIDAGSRYSADSVTRQVTGINGGEINLMLDAMARTAGIKVDIFSSSNQGVMRGIGLKVASVANSKGYETTNRDDPNAAPFIVALTELVDTMAKPKDGRTGKVEMGYKP